MSAPIVITDETGTGGTSNAGDTGPVWAGDVPGALQNIAETYESELNVQLRVLTNLIEPAMIILMAIGVGGLLFSILSAMFAITGSLNR